MNEETKEWIARVNELIVEVGKFEKDLRAVEQQTSSLSGQIAELMDRVEQLEEKSEIPDWRERR